MQNVSPMGVGGRYCQCGQFWGGHWYRPLRIAPQQSAMVLGGFVLWSIWLAMAGVFGLSVHQAVLDVCAWCTGNRCWKVCCWVARCSRQQRPGALLWRGRGSAGRGAAWLQAWSGGYLALFLGAWRRALGAGPGLDTNFHSAAAGPQCTALAVVFCPVPLSLAVLAFWRISAALPTECSDALPDQALGGMRRRGHGGRAGGLAGWRGEGCRDSSALPFASYPS